MVSAEADFSSETGLGSFVSSGMTISSLGTATPLEVSVVQRRGCGKLVRESLHDVMGVTMALGSATFVGERKVVRQKSVAAGALPFRMASFINVFPGSRSIKCSVQSADAFL